MGRKLIHSPFGVIEQQALKAAELRRTTTITVLRQASESETHDQNQNSILVAARQKFQTPEELEMEVALKESLRTYEYEQEQQHKNVQTSGGMRKAITQSLSEIHRKNEAAPEKEEEMVKKAIEASLREEDDILKQTMKQSKTGAAITTQAVNPAIQVVIDAGFSPEIVHKAYSIVGGDPEAMIVYIIENIDALLS